MVKQYLADTQVVCKNTLDQDFADSQRVFVTMLQTPLQRTDQSNAAGEPAITYEVLRSKLASLTQQHAQNQKDLLETSQADKR